jgi:hypothetical protein
MERDTETNNGSQNITQKTKIWRRIRAPLKSKGECRKGKQFLLHQWPPSLFNLWFYYKYVLLFPSKHLKLYQCLVVFTQKASTKILNRQADKWAQDVSSCRI